MNYSKQFFVNTLLYITSVHSKANKMTLGQENVDIHLTKFEVFMVAILSYILIENAFIIIKF